MIREEFTNQKELIVKHNLGTENVWCQVWRKWGNESPFYVGLIPEKIEPWGLTGKNQTKLTMKDTADYLVHLDKVEKVEQ